MAGGFDGLLDFAGYSVGAGVTVPIGGFVGLLDFTGYPVGAGVRVGGGLFPGGRVGRPRVLLAADWLQGSVLERVRRRLLIERMKFDVATRLLNAQDEIARRQQLLNNAAVITVVAEL